MSQHVANLVAAIDRKDADGIRAAGAPGARLVAMAPNTFQVHEGVAAVAANSLQSESGLVAANGGRPIPVPVHDTLVPFIMTTGIRAALREREQSGSGQVVEASLREAAGAVSAHRLIRDGSDELTTEVM